MANLVAEDGMAGAVEALGAHLVVVLDVDQVVGTAHRQPLKKPAVGVVGVRRSDDRLDVPQVGRPKRFTDDVALLLLDGVRDVLEAALDSERAHHALRGDLPEVGLVAEVTLDEDDRRLHAVLFHLPQNRFVLRCVDVAEDKEDVHQVLPFT